MSTIIRLVVLGLLAASPCLLQAKEKETAALDAGTKTQFAVQAESIRAQLKSGGRYEFVKPDERGTIDRRLDEMQELLSQADSASDLSDDQKVKLMVAQEEINAILTMRDGRRLICETVSPVGSHRKIKQCGTYAERERSRIDSQKYLRDTNRKDIFTGAH